MSQESEISDESSPSLLNNLRQFRFQKSVKRMPSIKSAEKNDACATQDNSQTVYKRKRIVICIESDSDEDTATNINEKMDEDTIIKNEINNKEDHTKILTKETNDMGDEDKGTNTNFKSFDNDDVIILDSDTDIPTKDTNDTREAAEITDGAKNTPKSSETAEVKTKEECFRKLGRLFPSVDRMVLQNTLEHNSWDLEKAIARLSVGKSTGQIKRSMESSRKDQAHKKVKRKHIDDIEEEKDDDDDDDNDAGGYEEKVFDSDESDDDISYTAVGDRKKVVDFLSNASVQELRSVSGCTQKKVDIILEMRPFQDWNDLVNKFRNGKFLGTDLLNSAQDFIRMIEDVKALMKKCKKLATRMEHAVLAGANCIKKQPSLLTQSLTLAGYQMVGLNWLWAMHGQKLNGILADEMGLGKTIQVIALLAHLKEVNSTSGVPHLIIVPSSTMDNWKNEFGKWCPTLNVVMYYGSRAERKLIRVNWSRNGLNNIDVILSTYNIVNSSREDKKMFQVLEMHYVVLDEAHMLKNMTTVRYEGLMRINARHRILLTGTPLQNNLLELMSLLIFVMPKIFAGKKEHLKLLFPKTPKQVLDTSEGEMLTKFEQEQVSQARRIMKPFVLRRLKVDVLKDLPTKTHETLLCPLHQSQKEKYDELIKKYSANPDNIKHENSMVVMMQLRRMSNHPLLLRYHYQEHHLKELAKILAKDPTYNECNEEYIFQDLTLMSDFELHTLTQNKGLSKLYLQLSLVYESGKFQKLDSLLPELKNGNHRVLIFSQFVIMLNVMEEYLRLRKHNFLRLDGSTPVETRQELIDRYNDDPSIFVFMLSTKAGGMGINLTAADTVIIHDIDFNPYNDKQAEDRCHRVGQTRNVRVLRLLSEGTIEEGMYRVAQEKLTLEKKIHNTEDAESTEIKNVASLLKQTLGLDGLRTMASQEGKS